MNCNTSDLYLSLLLQYELHLLILQLPDQFFVLLQLGPESLQTPEGRSPRWWSVALISQGSVKLLNASAIHGGVDW